ncbi:unnamed protein product [Sphagnum troendelagicum]|uniref:C2H2-type domain-containing protein n=1 Tax=Sphagnum troendelagicum TaxID=128251 RepID=A0ABP0UT68_9BRYO
MAVVPPPMSSYSFGDSLFSHLQLGAASFPSLMSTNSLPAALNNETCSGAPVGTALGGGGGAGAGGGVPASSVAMAAAQYQSLSAYNKCSTSTSAGAVDNAAFGSWNFAPFLLDYYTLGTNLQTVVDSMYPPVNDYLSQLLVSDDTEDFLSNGCSTSCVSMPTSSGCATPVMHPNLVSTLKTMVSPASDFGGPAGSLHLFEAQQPIRLSISVDDAAHVQQQSIAGAATENPCITQQHPHALAPPTIKQEMEKSESSGDDNMMVEAAVVSVDLIHNRRPFKCTHDGCNKTFKNPQTMKMHHKTHYAELGSAARSRAAGLAAAAASSSSTSLTASSLKAGHNKKIPSRCPKCKKTFVGLYELRRHYGRKHSEGEKGFGCRKCGKRFYIEVDVRDHEKLCGEPIECKCGLKFAFKCNLVAHKKAHPACQDNNNNHGAAAANSASDDSASDQTSRPGNNSQLGSMALSFKSAGSSRSTGSQGSSRSDHHQHHHQQQQQHLQEDVTSPHVQSLLQSPIDFAENFKQSTKPECNLSGMQFPINSTSADTSLWPPMQYVTDGCNSTPAAMQQQQFQSFFNFGYGSNSSSYPFYSISDSGYPLQQNNKMSSSKNFGSTLLEDLVNSSSSSSHGMQLRTAASLPTSMGNCISSTAAYYNSSCSSFSNLQALKDGSLQKYM